MQRCRSAGALQSTWRRTAAHGLGSGKGDHEAIPALTTTPKARRNPAFNAEEQGMKFDRYIVFTPTNFMAVARASQSYWRGARLASPR